MVARIASRSWGLDPSEVARERLRRSSRVSSGMLLVNCNSSTEYDRRSTYMVPVRVSRNVLGISATRVLHCDELATFRERPTGTAYLLRQSYQVPQCPFKAPPHET